MGCGADGEERSVKIYCTSFCNQGHDLQDGEPVGHECYVLNPAKLKQEAEGVIPGSPMHGGEIHKGKRSKTRPARCVKCGDSSLKGLRTPLCQYHYNEHQWGKDWADAVREKEVIQTKTT